MTNSQTIQIFIVDDEPELPNLMEKVLEKYLDDFEMSSASDGLMAIEKIKTMMEDKHPPDIIIMDLKMPQMDGIDCTRRLTEMGLTNIHILSAFLDSKLIEEAVAAGARSIIQKSEGFSNIAQKIAKQVRGR